MIRFHAENDVATLTLDRPERHNALELDDIAALRRALDQAAAANPRAMILTGKGRSFCAGVSLGDVGGEAWSENPLTALCDAIESLPFPTVAALNGGVYGGGAEIALSCDFRIGVRGMRCFVPPARLGIHYEPAGLARAMRVIGLQAARRMFLAADEFTDEDLLRIGFLDDLTAPEDLPAAAMARARRLADLAPLAVQGMKRTLGELSRGALDAQAAARRVARCWASEDLREGLAAMRDKRAPVFKGR